MKSKYWLPWVVVLAVACSDQKNPVDGGQSSSQSSGAQNLSSVSGSSSGTAYSSAEDLISSSAQSSSSEKLGVFNLVFVDSSNGKQYLSGIIDAPDRTELTDVSGTVLKDGQPYSAVRIRFGTTLLAWKQANPGGDLSRVALTGPNSLNVTVDLFDNGCDGKYEFIITARAGTWSAADTAEHVLERWAPCN